MKCLSHSIKQSLQFAYAHHIQRLMVTGNFALLAGIHPDEVDSWYLGIYIDALDWVEITNTRGMSQFADGGIVGTTSPGGSAKGTGTAPVNQLSNAKKNFIAQNQNSTDSEIYVVAAKTIGGTASLWVDFQWREIY
jgi:hypothetical protein